MNEVKRYRFKGAAGEYVYANDYDAAQSCAESYGAKVIEQQSELAALREELAKFDEGMRALACSLGAGGYNAETLSADQLVGKIQWGIDHLLDVHERRLTAAEQRNTELVELTKDALKAFNYHPEGSCYNPGIAFVKPWSIRAAELIKPTESGASE